MTLTLPQAWFGRKADGTECAISHRDLMEWAHEHDRAIDCGWGDAITTKSGLRLARTRTGAAKQGWDDIVTLDFDDGLRAFQDGNAWCCVGPDFTNIQESPCAFASTPSEAVLTFEKETTR